MANYRITGVRYLKKYASEHLTPTYAANVDAILADGLLSDVPWERVNESTAQMTLHTDAIVDEERGVKGLDMNVEIRNCFDAALFCSEHIADTGSHRGNANAACYVFELPDMETYPNLTSVVARVTSDPYNSGGVRLAVHVSDTLDIPREMSVIREGVAYVAGAVPRGERTDSEGVVWWHAQTDDAEIAVASVPLKKYLFLYVGLEDYTRSRGDWLEGSAFIAPTVEIVTDGDITGWSEGGVESAGPGSEYVVCTENYAPIFDDVITIPAAEGAEAARELPSLEMLVAYLTGDYIFAGELPQMDNFYLGYAHEYACAAYQSFYKDQLKRADIMNLYKTSARVVSVPGLEMGASFSVGCITREDAQVMREGCLLRKKVLVPFFLPGAYSAKKMTVSWAASDSLATVTGTPILKNIWIAKGKRCVTYSDSVLQRHELYDCCVRKVGDWELVASLERTVGDTCDGIDIPVDIPAGVPHTILLTCFIDISALDFDTEVTYANPHRSLGAGLNEDYVGRYHYQAHPGGWMPKIVLKG